MALTIAAAFSAPVSAQVLEEVVVTAQKREQNAQNVGISLTAFSGDQIRALGLTNTTEITAQIPGLDMVAWSPTLTAFNIRGVSQNSFTDNLEGPVAVYFDEAYVASMNGINAQMFDMRRVEVLRGPQGTLFGRNATGGVIHYVTRRADEGQLNGYVDVSMGDFDMTNIEAAVGGAISDKTRYRLSMRSEKNDGYIKSKPFPEGNPLARSNGNLGGASGIAARLALQFDIGVSSQLNILYRHSDDSDVPTGGYSFLPYSSNTAADVYIPPEFTSFVTDVIGLPAAATREVFFCASQLDCFTPVDAAGRTIFRGDHPEPHESYADYAGYMDREINSLTIDVGSIVAGGLELRSISNWSNIDKFYTEDGDGIPVPIIEFTTIADFTQWSQEIRLAATTDRLRWQAGVYFLDIEMHADVLTRGAPVTGVALGLGYDPGMLSDPAVAQDYRLDSRNLSIFGQIEYDVVDELTLIAGIRYSRDDKEMDFVTNFQAAGSNIFVPGLIDIGAEAAATGTDDDEIDYKDYAARLQLDWHINETTLAFFSASRGIKGGNFAPSANVTIDRIKHDEEVLHALEAGLKMEMIEGRLRLNTTVFNYNYDDYQAFTFLDGTPSVTNADADNRGLEIELVWVPNENWDIVVGAALQDSEANGVQMTGQQVTPVGFQVDWPVDKIDGAELPNTPEISINYLVRYNFSTSAGNIALQLDGVYHDDQYLEVTNGGAAFQSSYSVMNARFTWLSQSEKWQASAWVRNLHDQVYKQYALDLGILGGTVFYAPPRWSGFNISYNF